MKLNIVHTTSYIYSDSVSLLTHYLRFKPQNRSYLTLDGFELKLSPNPMSVTERIDAENNPYFQVWMEPVPIKKFTVKANINVTLERFDPFHFIIDPPINFFENQFHYSKSIEELLKPYMSISKQTSLFSNFLSERIKGSDRSCILFITDLLRYISKNFDYVRKDSNITLDADEIFKRKTGSCKELSWMLIEMLRSTGLAARFVSGYAYKKILGAGHELHAWVEVLLPGAGWIGLDPCSGLLTDERYVPVATSFNPSLTMPITGAFTGAATSKLQASVLIEEIEEDS